MSQDGDWRSNGTGANTAGADRRCRTSIRVAVLLSAIVLVVSTIRHLVRQTPLNHRVGGNGASTSSAAFKSSLPVRISLSNHTFTITRTWRGSCDLQSGPTDTETFTSPKSPWAVAYYARRRSRQTLPMMFGAGVIGEDANQRRPFVRFYEPGKGSKVIPDTKGIGDVEGIVGKCHFSVYAVNCDWEIGIYMVAKGGQSEPSNSIASVLALPNR